MLLVIELGVADLAATRFSISPLCETVRAVHLLSNPSPPSANRPWVRCPRAELDRQRGGRTVLYQASALGLAVLGRAEPGDAAVAAASS